MFYYYGGKARIAGRYPAPLYRTVIEPFAGAAGYSMHHLRKGNIDRAILIEKDPRVFELWRRLLAMTPEDVLNIPIPKAGDETADFFYMTTATSNGVAVSRRMTVTKRMPELVEMMRRRVAGLLPFAQGHVEVIHGDYRDAPDVEATWFIDPPYQPHPDKATSSKTHCAQGLGYAPGCDASCLDFPSLGEWARTRRGQALVVEQEGADWLPFVRVLAGGYDSQGRRKPEVLWTQSVTHVETCDLDADCICGVA